MEIRVDLGVVGTDLGQLIEAKLDERKLPKCLGNMIPPMLSKVMDVEDSEILALTASLKDEEKLTEEINMQRFVVSGNIDKTKVSLTKVGLEKVEHTKIDLANIYVRRLSACVTCEVAGVCNQLTQNYLKIISLNEKV